MKLVLKLPHPISGSFLAGWPLLPQAGLWLDQHASLQTAGWMCLLGDWSGDVSLRKTCVGFHSHVCAQHVHDCVSCICEADVSCMGTGAFSTTSQAEENFLGWDRGDGSSYG